MEKYILAIDQGTTSSRAILFDHEGNLVSTAQKEIENFFPQPGWVEQSADEIYGSVAAVLTECLAKAGLSLAEVAAIGISNQRETTIVWDSDTGKPVYFALVWQSKQSESYCEEKRANGHETFIKKKTGLLIDPYFSASKIRWILDHIENGQKRAEAGELLCGTVDSWLLYRLSGNKVHKTDVSNASRTLLMDIHTLSWSKELCDIWNIPLCILPEICATSTVLAVTDATVFGMEVPIASVVGDQQAALFGQTCFKEGEVKNTYGTGCFLLMNTGSKPVFSSQGLVTSVGWKIENEVTYVLEGSVFVAGAAVQWLRDQLQIIPDAPSSEEKAKSVKDNGGVVVVPAFSGLGAPYWKPNVTGGIFGLTRGSGRGEITRATLESLAYQTNDVILAMSRDTGFALSSLKVDGGACKNDLLMQWQADVSQTQVHRPVISETTALGAAYLAGLAVGYWKNSEEIASRWRSEVVFEPKQSASEMKVHLERWEKAVKAAMLFGE